MRFLVTGANGMVGRSLCNQLRERGHFVRAAFRSDAARAGGGENIAVGSFHAHTDWSAAVKNIDVVVHLAARVHVMNDEAADPLAEFRKVNVAGTLALARQAGMSNVKRIVFVSSVKVHGEYTLLGESFSELDLPAPKDDYALSKHEAERGLTRLMTETGMEITIIRPPLIYGPGVKANFGTLARAVHHGWILPLGGIKNKRSMVALDNLVDFIFTCSTHPRAANEVFLVSDGQDMSTTELVYGLASAVGVHARLVTLPAWAVNKAGALLGAGAKAQRLFGNLQVDISKAQSILGWRPPISVSEGLARLAPGRDIP